MSPRVSVVMIFLDAERFLEEAVSSVLAQTFADWEIILVDDGSSDGSTALARDYAARHADRIRCIEHARHVNLGMSASRNVGIALVRGEYLALLDADDVWLPEKLERQVAALDEHPEADLTTAGLFFWFSWTGNPADREREFFHDIGRRTDALVMPPELVVRELRQRDGFPAPSGAMMRTAAVRRVGGFVESFRGMYEDAAFFGKLLLESPAWVMPGHLHLYRQHPESCSWIAIADGEYVMDASVPHPARGQFLDWYAGYIAGRTVDASVHGALAFARWPYHHPHLAAAGRFGQRLRPLGGKAARRLAGQTVALLRTVLPAAAYRGLRNTYRRARSPRTREPTAREP